MIEDALEDSIGGIIDVTDVEVTAEADGAVRRLVSEEEEPRHLRGGYGGIERYLQEAVSNGGNETEIDFITSPDGTSNLTRAQQAAEQVNMLAEGGLTSLLEEMGLPPDSNVTISNLVYAEGGVRPLGSGICAHALWEGDGRKSVTCIVICDRSRWFASRKDRKFIFESFILTYSGIAQHGRHGYLELQTSGVSLGGR